MGALIFILKTVLLCNLWANYENKWTCVLEELQLRIFWPFILIWRKGKLPFSQASSTQYYSTYLPTCSLFSTDQETTSCCSHVEVRWTSPTFAEPSPIYDISSCFFWFLSHFILRHFFLQWISNLRTFNIHFICCYCWGCVLNLLI